MTIKTFAPGAATVNITAGAASQPLSLNPNCSTVRVVNTGTAPAFIHFGDATASASLTASMPILNGATETFTKGSAAYVHVISSGTPTLYFTAGEGL